MCASRQNKCRQVEELTSLVVWNFRSAIFDSELVLIDRTYKPAKNYVVLALIVL